jgi:hypothetical protein
VNWHLTLRVEHSEQLEVSVASHYGGSVSLADELVSSKTIGDVKRKVRDGEMREVRVGEYGHSQSSVRRARQRNSKKAHATYLLSGDAMIARNPTRSRRNVLCNEMAQSCALSTLECVATHLYFTFPTCVAAGILPSLAIRSFLRVQRRRQVGRRHSSTRIASFIRGDMILNTSRCRAG